MVKNKYKDKDIAEFEKKVLSDINKFKLFDKKDKILVAASGGKDSTAILYLLKKHNYNVEAITVDQAISSYSKKNLQNTINFCRQHKIKLHKISFQKEFGYSLCSLQSILTKKGAKFKSCTTCGVLRRYLINKKSRSINPAVVVTGHNLDDEAQSVLMNLLKNNLEILTRLGPKTGITKDKKFIPRVKPLYLIPEKEIAAYSKLMAFPVIYERCPCASVSYRNHIRNLLNQTEKTNPKTKQNIISNFLKILPKLRKNFQTTQKINYCEFCKEPTKHKICQTCKILSLLKA
ncbi:TIGR00269 family protein [Candidatus Woesearchaeota archaeon]|nr:TIGR00269 family protein [Candidatus Woesearchaeota archaeon]